MSFKWHENVSAKSRIDVMCYDDGGNSLSVQTARTLLLTGPPWPSPSSTTKSVRR